MRYLLIFLTFLLMSCGECVDVQIEKNDMGDPLLLCQQNFNVIVDHRIVEEELNLIAGAAFYWDDVLDNNYFFQVYPQIQSEEQFAGEIIVKPSEDVKCGAAAWWDDGDCIVAGIIYINARCRAMIPGWKESLYRHEFGHLLGLGHSECDDDLMAPLLSISRDDYPVDANPETIAKLKQLYHDKYGW